jgi:hypothetical protein
MDANRPGLPPQLLCCAMINVIIGHKPLRIAADDRQHRLQILPNGPDQQAGAAAADADLPAIIHQVKLFTVGGLFFGLDEIPAPTGRASVL